MDGCCNRVNSIQNPSLQHPLNRPHKNLSILRTGNPLSIDHVTALNAANEEMRRAMHTQAFTFGYRRLQRLALFRILQALRKSLFIQFQGLGQVRIHLWDKLTFMYLKKISTLGIFSSLNVVIQLSSS